MPTILERLNGALSPEFQLEREIASGGMGIVFLAHDSTLDRKVAIKVIRPEQATARASEKFLREARILANLRHPNVVPVHSAGEGDGLFYYVMDYISEGTLSDRLSAGPLPPAETLKLGRDLLDALESVHDAGVVHRDIKPSNIFLIDNRAVLTDFGISKPSPDSDVPGTTDSQVMGTVGYMPPEQAYARPVTNRTDLYAVAMVLYEAYTSRRWSDAAPDTKPNWSGVPASVVPVLRKALAWEPEKRWPDAATFRRALWNTRTLRYKRYKWYATAVAATTLLIGSLIGRYVLRPRPSTHDLAILPFVAEPSADSALAETADRLRELTRYHLEGFSRPAPLPLIEALMRSRIGPASIGETELDELGVQYAAYGIVTATGDSLGIAVVVLDSLGRSTDAGTVSAAADAFGLERTAHEIGFRIAQVVDPNKLYEGSEGLAHRSNAAITAFVNGRRAFKGNAYRTAVRWFRAALDEDPNFALATYWLANAWRWLGTGEPAPDANLPELLEAQGSTLSERERQLISAQLAPQLSRRYEIYRALVDNDPRDPYVAAMYAEELYNRGAFAGYPSDFVIAQLEDAVRKDSTFGPILGSLARSYIRAGNRERAEQALAGYEAHFPEAYTDRQGDLDEFAPELLRWAISERFYPPDSLGATRTSMLAQPEYLRALPELSRLAQHLGLPETQATLANTVLSLNMGLPDESRASLHESRALALIALGRTNEALNHFDSAAVLSDTPSFYLEAELWRVVAQLVGMPGDWANSARVSGPELGQLIDHSEIETRAIWGLGLKAVNSDDNQVIQRSLEALQSSAGDTTAQLLADLLNAVQLGSTGRFRQALAVSQDLLAYDSAAHGGDPFSRAVLHMKRADWLDSLGNYEAADSSRLWYEHFELIRTFAGEAQAAEIDWALSTFAMWLRGAGAAARNDRTNACKHLPRVVELWSEADAPLLRLRDSASTLITRLRCR